MTPNKGGENHDRLYCQQFVHYNIEPSTFSSCDRDDSLSH